MKVFVIAILMSAYSLTAQEIVVSTIQHQSLERSFRLVIPTSYDGTVTFPLVFNLHGFGSTAAEQEFYSDMNRVAESEGFIICYPNGIDNSWNVGWEFGSEADDVDFINTLIDQFSNDYKIDENKIYSCGMSNGGFMSYRLACELNDRIAVVASVTGSMAPLYFPGCDPAKAVSVLQIHGTADSTVLYDGSEDVGIPIDTLVAFWAANNGCKSEADTNDIEDITPEDNTTVKKIQYKDCNNDTEVVFYKVDGGGHTWPGAFLNIGVTNQDIEASEVIWEFFSDKSLNDQTSPVFEITENKDFTIFPNPTSHAITIKESDHLGSKYFIYNIQGKLITEGINDLNHIDISSLSKGYYTITIRNNKTIATGRFSKI